MAKKKAKAASQAKAKSVPAQKGTYVQAEDLPRRSLADVVLVSKQLHETFAGRKTTWDQLAEAIGVGKKSASTKYLFWGAVAYGIVNREEKNSFSLSEVGRKIVAPTYEGESLEGIAKAVVTPTLLSKFFADYDKHPIPNDELFPNVLEQNYAVPRDRTAEAKEIIVANAEYAKLLGPQMLKGGATSISQSMCALLLNKRTRQRETSPPRRLQRSQQSIRRT